MGCCGPTPTGAGTTALDDGKRVNYTLGMLLGVDDFLQEAAYQNARRHELARELLGYGTARGLQVLLEGSGSGPRVRVTPGMAWMPSGRAVCVGSEQCCDLNAWLLQEATSISKAVQGAGANPVLPLFVVLSFAECLTDLVPIPGEPCRSDDKLTAASRITDGFRLELRLSAPPQREEDAIRDFADWLSAVPVDSASPPMSEADFMAQLRAAAQAWLVPSSPALSPSDFMFGSPPASLVAGGQLLHAAFMLWVTELRPVWRARYGCGPGPLPPGTPDDAVLLAEVALALEGTSAGWQVDDARDSTLDESRRPVLLSLRMVQELITRNPAPEPAFTVQTEVRLGQAANAGSGLGYARADHTHGTPTLSGDATVLDEAGVQRVRVEGLRRVPIASTAANLGDALVLRASGTSRVWTPEPMPLPLVPGTTVVSERSHGQTVAVGTSTAYARADHSHGTPTLIGDVTLLSAATGDVRVDRLRQVPIAAAAGNAGDVLRLVGSGRTSAWTPQPLPAVPTAGAAPTAALSFALPTLPGTSLNFARADHQHGTPDLRGDAVVVTEGGIQRVRIEGLRRVPIAAAAGNAGDVLTLVGAGSARTWTPQSLPAVPTAGAAPTAALSFALPTLPGTSLNFARADHQHGTPDLRGDAVVVTEGGIQRVRIEGLRRVPIAPGPGNLGDVLVLRNAGGVRQWTFEPLPSGGTPGPSGNFVGRRAEAFELVGAGHCFVEVEGTPGGGPAGRAGVRDGSSYGGLAPEPNADVSGNSIVVQMRLPLSKAAAPNARHIVKLTPVWLENSKQEFMPYLLDRVFTEGDNLLFFRVRLRVDGGVEAGRFEFQAEVSRFEVLT